MTNLVRCMPQQGQSSWSNDARALAENTASKVDRAAGLDNQQLSNCGTAGRQQQALGSQSDADHFTSRARWWLEILPDERGSDAHIYRTVWQLARHVDEQRGGGGGHCQGG